jgi:2,5-diamino-6-(ribosylamino)-4(3H)-pyrimidinone 5'-phosphate reductase
MLNRLKEKEEQIQQVLEELREAAARGTPVVVEGKNDVETLHALGIEGNIVTAKTGGKSFLDIVTELEQSKVSEVILLLDFDRRGREGTKHLKCSLERAKIKPKVKFWRKLSALVGKEVQCIEGLTAYMVTLRSKIGVASQQSKS